MKKVAIKGSIIGNDDKWIYDYFEMDSTSPGDVAKQLGEYNGEEVEVEINSGGGDVFAGSEIYTAIKSYKGNVTVKIVGLAASAASVIAMAGKKIMMSPTAQMMIHNVSAMSSGDYRDMEHSAEVLKNANDTIANAYILKCGKSKEELLQMMDHETWMTAQQALEHKLIDEVMFSETPKLVAAYGGGILPSEVINKIRSNIKNPQLENKSDADFLIQQKTKLSLLRLKGDLKE